jgi:hypothetical protein
LPFKPCRDVLRIVALASLAAVPAASQTPQPSGPVRITITPTSVTASNLSSKETAVLIGMGVTFADYGMRRHVWRETVSDEDGDGAVTFTPSSGVPDDSIWVAIDVPTGRSTARSAGDRRVPAALGQLKRKEDKSGRSFVDQRLAAFGVVVAKAKGVWWLAAADGGPSDADRKGDGFVALDLADAETLWKGTPSTIPADLTADDHVIWLDPDRMDYLLTPISQISRAAN